MFIVTITGVCTRKDTTAHGDYLTLERFKELKEANTKVFVSVGDSAAVLTEDENGLKILYGRMLSARYPKTGSMYTIVTREGERVEVPHSNITRI